MYGLEDEDLQPQTALEDAEIDESDAWCVSLLRLVQGWFAAVAAQHL